MAGPHTPVMQQHAAAKRAYPDAIVFFRLGDFYEMFGEDAVLAARLLDLTLTSRNRGQPDEVPMAGVPHHAAHAYLAKLVTLGHKVAICEQMADPTKVKGIVPREVVRVVTPGLVTDGDQLDASTNNWLAAVDLSSSGVGIALLDLSTGELRSSDSANLAAVLGELVRAGPRELLVGAGDPAEDPEATARSLAPAVPAVAVRVDRPLDDAELGPVLGDLALDARALSPWARRAVGRVMRLARECHPRSVLPVRSIGWWNPSASLVIDPVAQRHLELVESLTGTRSATLLATLDLTRTPAGARLLRRRLLSPLVDVARIRRRLDLVAFFVENPRPRDEMGEALGGVGDLERLATRASLGEATPRDLGALRDGLASARRAVAVLAGIGDPGTREILGLDRDPPDTVDELANELGRALAERPPAQAKEGEIFRVEYDAELAELDRLKKSGAQCMAELEMRLRAETGIGALKLRYTRVFGWYVEVTRSNAGRVPTSWRRKQTVASGERYTTAELDDLADRILGAEDQYRERELSLLSDLVARAGRASERIRALGSRLARWDVGVALAEVAHRHDYCRPEVDDSDVLLVRDGRHPVVERLAAAGRFVPNDASLDLGGERLWLVTGPNMAGKSTFLRQIAQITILAQMGSYVPARAARIGVVDRVLSRVGASDNLARGESTFMVEMRETAEILRSATRRSLVILDEIGRGTSTFDGLSIAWAVAEHLDEVVGCRALFATHYHELTQLGESSRHVANYSVSARELGDDVVFLYRVMPGAASRSYGVAVARLAGLPEVVLARARALLGALESGEFGAATRGGERRRGKPAAGQLDLFSRSGPSAGQTEVIETLRALDVDRLTPIEALGLLARLKDKSS
jgi:DNA mismatch repair protein MutS